MARRIETIRGQRRGPRSGTGGAPLPNSVAELSVVNNGSHMNFFVSTASHPFAMQWTEGVKAVFDIDDDGHVTMHLDPTELRGYGLRNRPGQRPHFTIPTGDIGTPDAEAGQLYEVEELEITSDRISVKLPFTFLIEPEPDQLVEALEEQAEEPVEEPVEE